jgi:hypothetical protein
MNILFNIIVESDFIKIRINKVIPLGFATMKRDPGLSVRGGSRYFYLPKMVFGTS